MSDTQQGLNLSAFWKGYALGTNRGQIMANIKRKNDAIELTAILNDCEYGTTIGRYKGDIDGKQAKLRLVDCLGYAPLIPLDGHLVLTFEEGFASVEGRWSTDIGTSGACRLNAVKTPNVFWTFKLWFSRVRIWLFRNNQALYISLILFATILDLLGKIQISYPSLILLLIPSLFIFRDRLFEIFQIFKIRKIGFFEFEQRPVSEEVKRIVSQQDQETHSFLILEGVYNGRLQLAFSHKGEKAHFVPSPAIGRGSG